MSGGGGPHFTVVVEALRSSCARNIVVSFPLVTRIRPPGRIRLSVFRINDSRSRLIFRLAKVPGLIVQGRRRVVVRVSKRRWNFVLTTTTVPILHVSYQPSTVVQFSVTIGKRECQYMPLKPVPTTNNKRRIVRKKTRADIRRRRLPYGYILTSLNRRPSSRNFDY